MVRFTDSNVVVDDYPSRQRDNPSRNGRWSPDYYAGGAAPPSPGGSAAGAGGPYMTGPFPAPVTTPAPNRYADDSPSPRSPVLNRENSLQVPHWDRYRPRSVPPPLSPTTENSTMVFPPHRSRSRNHDRDRETYYDRDRERERDRDRQDDRSSRRKSDRDRETTKGRHRDRYYDSESSSSSGDERKGNKAAITRSKTPLSSKARQALSSTFSDSTTGLGAGVIGAIVGGLAAREASENLLAKQGGGHGHGHQHSSGKDALLSTIAGAAVGALGANAIEKRIEASRKKSTSGGSASPTAASGKGSDDGKNYTWGDERRRSSTTEEKRSSGRGDNRDRERNRDKDRDMETYRDRDIRRERDRSQRRGSKEDSRYYTTDDDDDEIVYDHHKRRSQGGRERDRERSRVRRDAW